MSTDLIFFHPLIDNDLSDNGGLVSHNVIDSDVMNNVFPDMTPDEVEIGAQRLRKVYIRPEVTLPYLRIGCSDELAKDTDLIHAGTETDTYQDAQNYTRWKGTGVLTSSISAGALSTITITSRNEDIGFNPLDLILIEDGDNEVFVRLKTVSWNGKTATCTLMPNSSIIYSFSAGAEIQAVVERGILDITSVWVKEMTDSDCPSIISNKHTLRGTL